MPSDIRTFFGGKPAAATPKAEPKPNPPKRGRARKVVDDEDEEDAASPKLTRTPKKTATKKREPTPEGEAVSKSDYFGSSKPKRAKDTAASTTTTPVRSKAKALESTTSTPNGRSSARKKKTVDYSESKPIKKLDDGDDDERDDIFTSDYKRAGRGGDDDYDEGTEDEDDDVDMKDAGDEEDEEDLDEDAKPKKKAPAASKAGRKRSSPDDAETNAAKKKKTAAPKKSAPKKKKEDVPENPEVQAIYDSIPTVRAPTPPPREVDADGSTKPVWVQASANTGPPPGGAAEIPQGEPDCLAGLTFVFTGLLETISREDGQALVKQYGGKVTTSPSSKTSYVVLGADAGPKKLETIKKLNIKTIDENGLFELIKRLPAAGGSGKAAARIAELNAKQDEKILKDAEEVAAEEKRKAEEAHRVAKAKAERLGQAPPPSSKEPGPDQSLWTVKYAPTRLDQVVGNKSIVTKLHNWLRHFEQNRSRQFRLGGSDGTGNFRAVMLHGPPGVGKTTAAHLVAKLEGYDVVESNASDTRSKKLVEVGLKGVLDTTSLNGYFAGDGHKVNASQRKLLLIMDEVDGMSAGDRGGVGALAAMCRKTSIPIILICNERKQPKMKPFDHVSYDLPFRRPTAQEIRPRMMTIGFRENIKLPPQVVDALIEGTNKDIRQVINMLSTAKHDAALRGSTMDFDDSKQMVKAWQKHVVLKPWDIVSKILGGGMFAAANKSTLNDKAELYFNDHEFSPLMLQENYLKTMPAALHGYGGPERTLKALELADRAAHSISDGDLVDRMIHGSEQHWALMPLHAMFSFVKPASYVAGTLAGGGGIQFTSWLGKNSAQNKAIRQVKEIQGHMRLRTSADRHEIRQQYVPLLWDRLITPLQNQGKEAVPSVIELMDNYFLTKEDWDSIGELGCGRMDFASVKIETQTKAAFTRTYNNMNHPMPFMKASNVQQPAVAKKAQPDLEEAIEESDSGEVLAEPEDAAKQDEADDDLSKDKYVRQPKKRAAKKAKGKAADEDNDDDEDAAPKSKAKGKAKPKPKAKK